MKKFKTYLLILMINFFSLKGFSQDSIACNCASDYTDPTPAGVMISHTNRKSEWMVSYRYMDMNMKGLKSGSHSISKEAVYKNYLMSPESMNMQMHMFMVMYGLSNRISLMGMLNYQLNSMKGSMASSPAGHHHGGNFGNSMRMESSGLSDVKLNVLYNILNNKSHQFLIIAGLSIPTGSIEMKDKPENMYAGTRLAYTMQTGSGTFDLLPGINYLFINDKISWSSQISSVIRTNYNKLGYRLGNQISLNNWISYKVTNGFSSSLRLEGNIVQKNSGVDPQLFPFYEPAADINNYGGKKIATYLGTNLFIRKCRLALEVGIPVYQNFTGVQMPASYYFNSSISLTL